VAALVLGACGSSTPAASSTSATSGSPTASGGGSSPATSAPAASSAPAANPPAVSGATDLKTEPVIGPGTAPAPTSLETKDLVVGTGKTAAASDTVQVQYVGADYTNGKDFDSSWSRGQPSSFPLNGVVPGFAQGIVGMKVGGRREIVIPPALGYGATGQAPAVSPDETLVFVVDLLAIQ
jgi:FKBP-type peptidyl-prolyl cis-trans isomerase